MAATLMLAGCGETGDVTDDIGTLWGEESQAEIAERERVERLKAIKVPVQAVRSVEIGRTRDGFIITAYGTAPGLGYSLPALRPRRGGQPSNDGFVEYDFVATEPAEGLDLPPGTTGARALRADLPVTVSSLRGAAGIRVLAIRGGVQLPF
jgi:hypothetical protein